jgi:hypothetical protein
MTEECWWVIAQAACGHAADQVPVCWSLDFNWFPSYIHVSDRMYIPFRHAPYLAERSYCLSLGVSVVSIINYFTLVSLVTHSELSNLNNVE